MVICPNKVNWFLVWFYLCVYNSIGNWIWICQKMPNSRKNHYRRDTLKIRLNRLHAQDTHIEPKLFVLCYCCAGFLSESCYEEERKKKKRAGCWERENKLIGLYTKGNGWLVSAAAAIAGFLGFFVYTLYTLLDGVDCAIHLKSCAQITTTRSFPWLADRETTARALIDNK